MQRLLVLLFVAAAAPVLTQDQVRPVDTSVRAVLAAATSYLKAYQEALQFVIADEQAVQEVFDERDRRRARRETTGDFFLAWVPADGGWLSVRDITKVDGKPVEAGEDLRGLLNRGSMASIGRAMADRNARYNIGVVTRNFNEPMFALMILDAKHQSRFRFERRSVGRGDAGTSVTLAFTERDRPTLVQAASGGPVFTSGELVLDAATGRLQRSVVIMKDGPTTAQLTTTFTENEKLKLWLPATMQERYTHSSPRLKEVVVVESTYTNYRKFEVTARIR